MYTPTLQPYTKNYNGFICLYIVLFGLLISNDLLLKCFTLMFYQSTIYFNISKVFAALTRHCGRTAFRKKRQSINIWSLHDTTLHCTALHFNTQHFNTIWTNTMRCDMIIQFSSIQFSSIQFNTIQYSLIQYKFHLSQ